MPESLWNRCLRVLEGELPEQQFNTWVRPLQAVERDGELKLLAPNRYVIEWLGQNLLPRIKELILAFAEGLAPEVALDVGTRGGVIVQVPPAAMRDDGSAAGAARAVPRRACGPPCRAASGATGPSRRARRRGQAR